MEWGKLYASMPRSLSLRRAGEQATVLFVFGLCHCIEQGTDIIENAALPLFGLPNVQRRADALVRQGAWEQVDGGYRVPNFFERQAEAFAAAKKKKRDAERLAEQRRQSRDASRDSRATDSTTVAGKSREELPPNPPPSGGRRKCQKHTRPKTWCPDCSTVLPDIAPACGECGPNRLVDLPDGKVMPCPRCHPKAAAS